MENGLGGGRNPSGGGGGVLSRFSYWDFQETDLGEKDVLLTFKLVSCQNVNVLIHSSAQFTVLSLWGGWGSGGQGLANRRVQGTMESGRGVGRGRPGAWKETSGGGGVGVREWGWREDPSREELLRGHAWPAVARPGPGRRQDPQARVCTEGSHGRGHLRPTWHSRRGRARQECGDGVGPGQG